MGSPVSGKQREQRFAVAGDVQPSRQLPEVTEHGSGTKGGEQGQTAEPAEAYSRLCRWLLALDDRILAVLTAESPAAYRRARNILAGLVCLGVAALLYMGPVHQRAWAEDTACWLDGAWRVLQGLRPHIDFYSHLGPVSLLITASGMWLLGPSARAMTLGYTIAFPIVTAWAWIIARRRFTAFHAFTLAAMIGFLVIAPSRLDESFRNTTYAMHYNRFCWSLTCIMMVQLFMPPRRTDSRLADALGGLSSGVILALLLFTKITYFMAGVLGVAAALLLTRSTRRTWAGFLTGFLAVFAALLAYLRFDILPFVHDMRMLANVQTPLKRIETLLYVTWGDKDELAVLLLLALALTPVVIKAGSQVLRTVWLRLVTATFVMAFLGLLICGTNTQSSTIPLIAVGAVVLSEGFRRADLSVRPSGRSGSEVFLTTSIIATFMTASIVLSDGSSIVYAVAWRALRADRMPKSSAIDSEVTRDMVFQPRPEEPSDEKIVRQSILALNPDRGDLTPYQYVQWVNDGISLLRRHVTPKSRVVSLTMFNPFSFPLQLPSPRGDALAWHYEHQANDEFHPPAELALRDADFVMRPKRGVHPPTAKFKLRIFGPLLQDMFEKIDESDLWILYQRRHAGAG